MKLRKMCFKRKKLICLFFIMSLFLIFNISNAKANNIHYNYTFESVDLNLELKFNRTSNLRPQQEFHNGVFDGEFSFTGLEGTDIDDLEFIDNVYKDYSCNGIIIDLENHNDTLKITDYNSSGLLNATHTFESLNNSVISFWINSIDVSLKFYMALKLNLTNKVYIRIFDDMFQYKNLLDNWIYIPNSNVNDDIWHHIKMVLNCSLDTFDFYLDGSLFGNDLEFNELTDSINNFWFSTDISGLNTVYIDAIDIVNGTIYNHSNVGILKTDTNQYEVDKYAFHQDDIDTRSTKSGLVGASTFGWQSIGNHFYQNGYFENPETEVIDNENINIQFLDNTIDYSMYLIRNYPSYTNSEIEIYYEFIPLQVNNLDVFGMYIFDSDADTILSIIQYKLDGVILHRISNGIDHVIITELEVNDLVKVRVLYNTEYEVFSLFTSHYDDSEVKTFEYFNILNSTIQDNFYSVKFNMFSKTTSLTEYLLDNIGVYRNGISLNEDSCAYAEIIYDSLETFESSLLFEGYSHVGTTYPNDFLKGYIIDNDDLDTLYNLGYNKESLDLGLCKDSLIFTLDAYTHSYKTIELIDFQDSVRLLENNDTYYKGTIERGFNTSIYSKYDVVNSRLEGYLESEGLINEWLSIEFDIDDFLTTNYSFIINDMYKTNWLFNTEFTMTFIDGTEFVYSMVSSNPFEITGNQFVSDFGTQLSKYKYIDTFKFNISGTIESEGTYILSGINSMKLHCNSLGFIDLDDLHDSGIIAIMIPLILLIFPTFLVSSFAESRKEGSGKMIFIPFFLIMATILFASAIIPTWIYFIIVLGFGALLILKKRLSHD